MLSTFTLLKITEHLVSLEALLVYCICFNLATAPVTCCQLGLGSQHGHITMQESKQGLILHSLPHKSHHKHWTYVYWDISESKLVVTLNFSLLTENISSTDQPDEFCDCHSRANEISHTASMCESTKGHCTLSPSVCAAQ